MHFHVEVRNLCKDYPGKRALIDVSFGVERGEIFALIGPNGAGKTTLLRILDLLDEPSSGTVLFRGAEVDYSIKDRKDLRRGIGMVFQRTVLFNMSTFDNVAYGLKVRGMSEREIREGVKAALELVRLQGFEGRNALALSGGEAQRVALAQALAIEPELLLLDEPTANLDPRNASIIEEVLSRVNREGKTTIIMSTHNVFQAENLAHRIALLNEGKIERIGAFQDIFERPHRFLSEFARLENVFSGFSKATPEGTSIIDVGNGLHIEAAFERSGSVIVHIPPEDIILSTRPIVSSARNTLEGLVVQISDLGSIVKLKVRSNRDFTAQITKRSFNDMKIGLNSKVFLAFKASSVKMI